MNKNEYDSLMRVVDSLVKVAEELEKIARTGELEGVESLVNPRNVYSERTLRNPTDADMRQNIRDALADIAAKGKDSDWEVTTKSEGWLFDPKLHGIRRNYDFGAVSDGPYEVRTVTKIPMRQGVIINWDDGPVHESDATEEQVNVVKDIFSEDGTEAGK